MSASIPVFSERPKAAPTPKLRALVRFPGNVEATTGIEVTKANGTYTFETDWTDFSAISAIPTSPTSFILTFDTATGVYVMVPSHLLGGAVAGIADAPNDGTQYGRQSGVWTPIGSAAVSPVFATGSGTYTVTSEAILLVNKTAPNTVQLPAVSARGGVSIIIKDYAGNAATNIITIVPNGTENIDGLSSLPISSNYGGFKLTPITTPTMRWFISP